MQALFCWHYWLANYNLRNEPNWGPFTKIFLWNLVIKCTLWQLAIVAYLQSYFHKFAIFQLCLPYYFILLSVCHATLIFQIHRRVFPLQPSSWPLKICQKSSLNVRNKSRNRNFLFTEVLSSIFCHFTLRTQKKKCVFLVIKECSNCVLFSIINFLEYWDHFKAFKNFFQLQLKNTWKNFGNCSEKFKYWKNALFS